MVRWLTDKVSDILCVGGGINDGLELCWSRFEYRLQFVFITIQGFGLIADACESATYLEPLSNICFTALSRRFLKRMV